MGKKETMPDAPSSEGKRKLRPYEAPGQDDVQEYQPAPQSTVDYLRSITPQKKRSAGRRILKFFLVLVVLAGLAGGAYWLFFRDKPAPAQSTPSNQQAAQPSDTEAKATKHHTSTIFSLEFDYPEDWVINETLGSGQLIARSPRVQLKDASSQTVSGHIVFTIRDKNQTLTEFNEGNAVAARDSEKIDYAKPSSVQRGATYLSFLRYARTASNKALDGIYVTGDTGYQLGQAIPKADFTPVDPIISVTFAKCGDQKCTEGKTSPLSIAASSWTDVSLTKPIKALLTSLVVN